MFLEMELHPDFSSRNCMTMHCHRGFNPSVIVPSIALQTGERPDGRGYFRYPDAGDYGDCRASSRTSCYDLPKVGGTEDTDSDSFFSKGISIWII